MIVEKDYTILTLSIHVDLELMLFVQDDRS
jgi:hypothetical protein